MQLEINHSTKAGSIKESFHNKFPFLKIEFVNKPHFLGEATPGSRVIHDNVTLGNITGTLKEGFITITEDDSVATIEQTFQEQFGLPVQVFRKHKDVWIETTATDSFTLARENEIGKEASMKQEHEKPGDRYLEDGQY